MFQRVTIIGNVGQDPQMRFTADGTPVTNVSVATKATISKTLPGGGERTCPQGWKESYNGKNWEVTTWFRVACWRKLAEVVNQYVTKGMQVYVEGTLTGTVDEKSSLTPRVYESGGEHKASFEMQAQTLKFLGGSGNGGGAPVGEAPPETGIEEDALPF